jgi:hypothetical protein
MRAEPHVTAPPLVDVAAWTATEVERPKIAESSGAVFTTWSARRSTTADTAFVAGCVATPIPGWVDDMAPAVEGRTVALAGAVAAKITEGPIDARKSGDAFELRSANDLSGPVIGQARTWVGFDDARVFTCFASCASKRSTVAPECEAPVRDARLEGSLPPPRPGLALGTVTWAVHHPRPAALGGLGFVVALGIVAVVFRRRPRSRIH